MKGKVISVNVSEKKGEIKRPVPYVDLKENFGIIGDAHAGAGIRQVSFLGTESVDKMRALGLQGLCFGKFAENVTTEGIVLYTLPIGTILNIGKEAVLRVTQIGKKCHAADGCEVARIVGTCVMPKEGIFAEVLTAGRIQAGDEIVVAPTQSV